MNTENGPTDNIDGDRGGLARTYRQHHPSAQKASESHNILSVCSATVKIYCHFSAPDFGQPWQLLRQSLSTSSGFVIKYNEKLLIVTNAHAVTNFSSVSVKRHGGSRKYLAQVLCIADSVDLAFLHVEDPQFWTDVVPLPIGGIPPLQSNVVVVGYPTGGDSLSFTSGVVSRLGVTTYAHSGDSNLSIQLDAAINSGNSGGPCVWYNNDANKWEIAGVAFETLNNASGIGYMIPTPVLLQTLDCYFHDNLGTSSLNIITQSIENTALRDKLQIPPLSGLLDYLYNCDDCDGEPSKPRTQKPQARLDIQTLPCALGSDTDDMAATAAAAVAAFTREKEEEKRTPRPTERASSAQHDDEKDDELPSPEQDMKSKLQYSLKRRRSLSSTHIYQAKHQILEHDEDGSDYVAFRAINATVPDSVYEGDEPDTGKLTTPVFKIHSSLRSNNPPPSDLLPFLPNKRDDTAIGIKVCRVIPFTKVSEVLQPGDVLLTINSIPIASDQTILLRENERVKYIHLISSSYVGQELDVLICRGFEILRLKVPVESKQYIARWSQYSPPSWMVTLGLVFVPLTSNLMESEYGSKWCDSAPVPLLSALFTGTFSRFHVDEEVVILTQILASNVTEGYDFSMRRVTHVNGTRIINLKHLSEIVNNAAADYERYEAGQDHGESIPMQSDALDGVQADFSFESSDDEISPDSRLTPSQHPYSTSKPSLCAQESEFMKMLGPDSTPAERHNYYASYLQNQYQMRYLTFALENRQEIVLDLANGRRNQLDLLHMHQIPVPGCSSSIKPMYPLESVIVGSPNLDVAICGGTETPTKFSSPGLPPVCENSQQIFASHNHELKKQAGIAPPTQSASGLRPALTPRGMQPKMDFTVPHGTSVQAPHSQPTIGSGDPERQHLPLATTACALPQSGPAALTRNSQDALKLSDQVRQPETTLNDESISTMPTPPAVPLTPATADNSRVDGHNIKHLASHSDPAMLLQDAQGIATTGTVSRSDLEEKDDSNTWSQQNTKKTGLRGMNATFKHGPNAGDPPFDMLSPDLQHQEYPNHSHFFDDDAVVDQHSAGFKHHGGIPYQHHPHHSYSKDPNND